MFFVSRKCRIKENIFEESVLEKIQFIWLIHFHLTERKEYSPNKISILQILAATLELGLKSSHFCLLPTFSIQGHFDGTMSSCHSRVRN